MNKFTNLIKNEIYGKSSVVSLDMKGNTKATQNYTET